MNSKKFWTAFIVVFIVLEVTNYLIHGVILRSTYMSDEYKMLFRPEDSMMANMWLMYLMDLVWTYFFMFFFVKGYEDKGIMEGIRYGFYIALFFSLVTSIQSFVVYPIGFGLAIEWFIASLIQALILGIIAAVIYKPKPLSAAA
jgi:uncharacterized membrane protein YvlD (DUF360 family)